MKSSVRLIPPKGSLQSIRSGDILATVRRKAVTQQKSLARKRRLPGRRVP